MRRRILEGPRRDVFLPEVATRKVVIGSISSIGITGPLGAAPANPLCPLRLPKPQGPLFLRRLSVVRPKRVMPKAVELNTGALVIFLAVALVWVMLVVTLWAPLAKRGGGSAATRCIVATDLCHCLRGLSARVTYSGTVAAVLSVWEVADAESARALSPAGPLERAGSGRGRIRRAGCTCPISALVTAPRPSRPSTTQSGAAAVAATDTTGTPLAATLAALAPPRRTRLRRTAVAYRGRLLVGCKLRQFEGTADSATCLGRVGRTAMARRAPPQLEGCLTSLGRPTLLLTLRCGSGCVWRRNTRPSSARWMTMQKGSPSDA